ncbi:hypothetical protein PYCCODRAFT_1467882 [Trametes coccinea BRFM310]|uniref:P-loop containing nucleoside triphosphate hydrolase protein n=1 Tax=Trametes coccinea (strain BRFM310) TaxID=1353009 RepID=A0A1Y2IM67_TRAC3|nr:hypothetical protein PYCCODRAFT_1467882 [Trametes coccinea BRFM310]
MSGRFGWLGRNGSTRRSKKSNQDNEGHDDVDSDRSNSRSASRDRDERRDTTIGGSDYARKRRELLKLARSLEDLGARSVIDMPRIVVIGAQSTGKSSLVEAVTGINVPRDSGTCTRCPMECTILTSGSTWSCKVSLRRFIGGEDQGTAGFSPQLLHSDDVELWIRRAQAAILCPHISVETIRNRTRSELKELTDTSKDPAVLKFTRDVVVIDIEDPNGADLSFVDLPGLVQNEEESIVTLVEDLVKDYVRPESTIILVTLPATDDLENHKAMRFAKEADPAGLRTIGVITKPDALNEGDTGKREHWRKIFEGKVSQHYLQKGYYCVRLPSDKERLDNMSRRRMQEKERLFFSETAPWKSLDRSRLGVANLVHDISALLMTIIQTALPRMREAVAEHLANCIAELDRLPPMMTEDSDVTAEVVRCIFQFCGAMSKVVLGSSEDRSFVRACRREFLAFEAAIRRTAPDFQPFLQPDNSMDAIALSTSPSESLEVSNPNDEVVGQDRKLITLPDVQRVIEETTGWELPGNVPYEAKERLIKGFMTHWSEAATRCFDDVLADLRERILNEAEGHFGRFPPLERHVKPILLQHLAHHEARSRDVLKKAVQREEAPLGTQAVARFRQLRFRWHARYKEVALQKTQAHRVYTSDWIARENRAISALRELGIHMTNTDIYGLVPLAKYEDELIVMADVRSYFSITSERFSDDVPEEIKANLLLRFVESVQDHLVNQLLRTSNATERLQKLVEEDPLIKRRRAGLRDKCKKLTDCKAKLDRFVL